MCESDSRVAGRVAREASRVGHCASGTMKSIGIFEGVLTLIEEALQKPHPAAFAALGVHPPPSGEG
jgi:hypothetical protein